MLSIETLYFSSTLSRLTILVIFGVLIISQPRAKYLWHWCFALACSGVGTLINGATNEDAATVHILPLVAMGLFVLSLIGSWTGLRIFYGKSVSLCWFAVSPLPSLLCFAGVGSGLPANVILPFLYSTAAMLAALSLYEVMTSKDKRLLSQYVVAFAFAVYTLMLAITAFMVSMGTIVSEGGDSAVASLAFDQAASILVYFGYLAMAGEKAALDLQLQAETDILTGLTNRRGGRRIIASLHKDTLEDKYYSLIIADIDHFKMINDSLGHDAGDSVLSLVAARLASMMRKRDVIIRWGGEEFLIVLPDTSSADAGKIAERLREKVSGEPFEADFKDVHVTLSLGVSMPRSGDSTFDATLIRADKALYQAKEQGRNRTVISA
ncbi:GGDEF domain-containing protein [Pseudomonas marginalis]|uniref:GGDEF domain-containing protein n=1 Tax=Pseudomonas marginalis TaxID=298 RepID=UPI002481034E|nr:GGDEF domain-containing protein [Pseudomonas marginalis]WGT28072.1 GGDEF domain-containing protein [Pseudomonas marginalis]